MKRKTVGIIVALLVLAVVGGTAWSLRDLPQKRLLWAAENVVFADADSAAALLARVDTTRLTESSLTFGCKGKIKMRLRVSKVLRIVKRHSRASK